MGFLDGGMIGHLFWITHPTMENNVVLRIWKPQNNLTEKYENIYWIHWDAYMVCPPTIAQSRAQNTTYTYPRGICRKGRPRHDDNDVYYGPRNKGTNRRFRGQPFSLQRGCKNEVISLVELLLTHVLVHIAAATAFLEAVWSPNAFQVTKKKKMTSIASGIITSGNESDQYSNNNCRRVSRRK